VSIRANTKPRPHASGFFQEPQAFEALKTQVYPNLKLSGAADPVRIWVAACPSAEEAYTHALNLLEYLDASGLPTAVRVFATTLDEGVLAKARGATFTEKAAAALSPERLSRWFVKVKGGYRAAAALRDVCVFARHDAALDVPFANVDLISWRTLQEPALLKRVLPLLHHALKPGGCLMIGASETPARFRVVDKKARIYAKDRAGREGAAAFALTREGVEWPSLPERRLAAPGSVQATPDFEAEVSRILLNSYTPAGVLVDDSLDIFQTHGATRRYLELPSGVVSTSLATMSDPALARAVGAAVQRAKMENAPVKRRVGALLRDGAADLQIDVIPVKTPLERRRRYLVLFAPLPRAESSGRPGKAAGEQLEFGQACVRDGRRAAGGADSAVEKLRRANEELEAANEMLATANEDLSRRGADLRAANAALADLAASAEIPVLVLDKDLRIRRFTPAAEAAFDLRASDAGKEAPSVLLDIPLPRLKEDAAAVLRGKAPLSREVRDSRGRAYDLWIRPHLCGERFDGVSLTLIDVTRRLGETLELRSSRDCANAALEALRVSWVVVDPALKVLEANASFYESFKTSAAKAAGRPLLKLGKKGLWRSRPLQERLHALGRDGAAFTEHEGDFDLPARGTRTLAIDGRPLARGEGEERRLLITLADVTERKEAAESAALRKSEGRQRDFVANVSHELMTPITAIKGYSEALVGGALDSPSKRLKFIQIIEKHADRLAQLVEDLLQLSTSEAGHKKAVDTVPLEAQVKRLLLGLAPVAQKKNVSIRLKVAPELKVAVNKSELNQIFQNLISNAIKYNRPKGRVTVAASVVGKRIIVSIQDTGIGVPKEDLARIFDRFHRAANARSTTERGTGLGLSIVKSILVAHGCRIWAESSDGRGSTFFFTLPKG